MGFSRVGMYPLKQCRSKHKMKKRGRSLKVAFTWSLHALSAIKESKRYPETEIKIRFKLIHRLVRPRTAMSTLRSQISTSCLHLPSQVKQPTPFARLSTKYSKRNNSFAATKTQYSATSAATWTIHQPLCRVMQISQRRGCILERFIRRLTHHISTKSRSSQRGTK